MAARRDPALDVAKGLAITLIVAGHVLRGLNAAGIVNPAETWSRMTDTALYLVHLPTFVILSGIFLVRSVTKRGAGRYLRGRAVDFLWLYVVWTIVQGLVKVATASIVNTPMTPEGLLEEFIRPTTQMWYLPFLLTLTTVMVLTRAWTHGALGLGVAALASVVAWGHAGSYILFMGWGLAIFFAAGVTYGYRRLSALLRSRRARLLGVVAAVVFGVLVATSHPVAPTSTQYGLSVPQVAAGTIASGCGVFAVLIAATALSRLRMMARFWAFLGARSMEIFLAHIMFTAATRIVLNRLGILDPWTHLALGIIAGLVGPVLLWKLTGRAGCRWIFSTPAALKQMTALA